MRTRNRTKHRGLRYGGLTFVFVALFPQQAIVAQETSARGGVLEEIVVTARKRAESLQDVPISVSAFTEKSLIDRQITSTDKLGQITPNLTFDAVAPSSGSSSAAQIFIRGIGQSDYTPVTDPGVGLYVDGIYMSRSVGNVLDFLDVERIEILRGPQGTLFGRNSIGGAISIHSKRPSDEVSASVQVEVGDDSMRNLTLKANGALGEKTFANVAFSHRERDGYVIRSSDGIDLGDDNSDAVRGSLLWEAADNVEVFVAADYTKIRENGAPSVSGGANDEGAFATFGNATLAGCPVVINNGGFGPPPFGPAPPGRPAVGGVLQPTAGPPSLPPPGVGTSGAPGCITPTTVDDPFVSSGTSPVKSDLDVYGVSAEVTWEANDWLTVKSITGYREVEMESLRDGDNTAANIFQTGDVFEHEQISQEIQLSTSTLEDRLDLLLGFYYFEEEGFNENPVTLPVGALVSGGLYENSSVAAFFQGTYAATDRLSLTFGARYTEDTKRFTPDQFALGDASQGRLGNNFAPAFNSFAGFYLSPAPRGFALPLGAGARILPFAESERKFDDFSIMSSISYDLSDDTMIYATYSEGFKSGGFDQRFAGPVDGGVPSSFDPEEVTSVELGIKTDLLDNSLRLSASLFYTDYEDLQIIVRETFNPITFNGGTAEIQGGELEFAWLPSGNLSINGSVGYIDAEYDELSDAVLNNNTPVLPGFSLANTPELSVALGIGYDIDLASWGAILTPRVDWSFNDEQYNDAINSPQLFQDSYNLVNASLNLASTDGRYEAALRFGNVTDETYLVTGSSSFNTAASYVEQVYGRPREWSLSFKYNF